MRLFYFDQPLFHIKKRFFKKRSKINLLYIDCSTIISVSDSDLIILATSDSDPGKSRIRIRILSVKENVPFFQIHHIFILGGSGSA